MNQIVERELSRLTALCGKYGVARLEIFGSAAGKEFNAETSDIDFLVEFKRVDDMNAADQYFGLLEELEKLFDKKIDLVMARAMRNRFFIRSVEQSRRTLFAA
jgi:predicted nucleotidyltransferase